MAKKDYFIVIDTETTLTDKVADFAAVVVDRTGKEYARCAVLVDGIFTDYDGHPLFHDPKLLDKSLWAKNRLAERYDVYNGMVASGQRMIASVAAINRWLDKVNATYKPYLTAYNVAFDVDKMNKTGIDCLQFEKKFCLWHAAFSKYAHTKKYRNFVLDNHAFNSPTKFGNMSYKTNAEVMARFVLGNPTLPDEPHTALEDIIGYEVPILVDIVKKSRKAQWLAPKPFNWRAVQAKDAFTAK